METMGAHLLFVQSAETPYPLVQRTRQIHRPCLLDGNSQRFLSVLHIRSLILYCLICILNYDMCLTIFTADLLFQ